MSNAIQIRIELHDNTTRPEHPTPIHFLFHASGDKYFLLQLLSPVLNPDQAVAPSGGSKYTLSLKLKGPASPFSMLSFYSASDFIEGVRLALLQCPSVVATVSSRGVVSILVIESPRPKGLSS